MTNQSSDNFDYILRCSSDQAKALSFAAEVVARIYTGQVDEIIRVLSWRIPNLTHEQLSKIRDSVKQISFLLMGSDATFGIGNVQIPEQAKTLWDLHQVIRNRIAWDEFPEGGIQVWFDVPMKTSANPLAEIRNRSMENDTIATLESDLDYARRQRDHLLGTLSWNEATAGNPMDDDHESDTEDGSDD